MKLSTIVAIIIAVVLVGGGWYWWMGQGYKTPATPEQTPIVITNTPATTTTAASEQPSAMYVDGNLLLGTDATSTLGTYLIGYNGMTLYKYTKDTAGVSNCSGSCAVNWPPYTITSTSSLKNVQAGVGGKVGSLVRADGTIQVTYNGEPLYFWIKDTKSGDTTGQNVGGVWFVVKP